MTPSSRRGPRNRKAAGTRREYAVRDAYREAGWYAFRTRDDQSVCDVVASRAVDLSLNGDPPAVREWLNLPLRAELRFIEVKSNVSGGAFSNFRKPAREALKAAAAKAGAQAILCWWPPRGERVDISAEDWPA